MPRGLVFDMSSAGISSTQAVPLHRSRQFGEMCGAFIAIYGHLPGDKIFREERILLAPFLMFCSHRLEQSR